MLQKIRHIFLVIVLTPFWLDRPTDKRKPWKEFVNGLKKHEHEFDYTKPIYETHDGYISKHYPCKHFGCNTVTISEKNGELCELINLRK